jgi:hypothetical protein
VKFQHLRLTLFVISTILIGCSNQAGLHPASPTLQSTATPFSTATPVPTNTFPPTTYPTIAPIYSAAPTRAPSLGMGWFQIPELTPFESITPKSARSFVGIKVPPFPDDIIEEFSFEEFIGEAPPSTIVHKVFIVRQGNARMLWIGVMSELGSTCCDDRYARIYDAIPLPATQAGDKLIAFSCGRNNEVDYSLIVIMADSKQSELATNIRYAWRIDPESITLKPVFYSDIVCWRW